MQQRNVFDIGDAVKSVTGVRPINRYGGFQTFRIRGFNNFVMLVDGVRDERHNISTSAPSTNLANVERIEVLKGPAGVLYGHSALGGIINIVRKKNLHINKKLILKPLMVVMTLIILKVVLVVQFQINYAIE